MDKMEELSIILSTANTISFLNEVLRGFAAGKREDLIINDLANAHVHYEILKTKIEEWRINQQYK